jgi:uncharacterized protein YciI
MMFSMKRFASVWVVVLSLSSAPAFSRGQQSPQHVYVVLYEHGAAWIEGKSVRQFPNFRQHVAHIQSIESRLLGAGPFAESHGETMVGMLLFFATSDEEARRFAESDPFVIAKYTKVSKVLRWQVDKLKGF